MNDPRKLDDKDWEKITEEAFASKDRHTFSFGYETRKASMLRGDTMKRKNIKHSSSRKMALHIAAAAALVAVVLAGIFFAGHNAGSPAAEISEDIPVTTSAEEECTPPAAAPETETVTEYYSELENIEFKKLQLNYVPEGLVYYEDGPHAQKYYSENGGGMSHELYVCNENCTFEQANFTLKYDKYVLEGKEVTVRYAADASSDPYDTYSRFIFVKFDDTPFVAVLHITDNFSDEEVRKVCEGMELLPADDMQVRMWRDTVPEDNASPQYLELQLHEKPAYAETMDEADALVGINGENGHTVKMPWAERKGVCTDYYTALLKDSGYDKNSLEAKSYLYHIMLNTPLYFSTAKGSFQNLDTEGNVIDEHDFQVDLESQEEYSYNSSFDGQSSETYRYDDYIIYVYENDAQKNRLEKQAYYSYTEDNYRHVDIAPPDYGLTICTQLTTFGIEGSMLSPDGLAVSRLCDFDSWSVSEITSFIGRDAAVIEGTTQSGYSYKMTVDINTGILLEYIEDNITEKRMTSLEVDVPIERKEYPNAESLPFGIMD